jgi:peroxin-5
LGVGCINIGCYKEAAEHFLGALSLHGQDEKANISNNLWETLRRTFILMERHDLCDLTQKRDFKLFRNEFDF